MILGIFDIGSLSYVLYEILIFLGGILGVTEELLQ